jgi:hypothetical protein
LPWARAQGQGSVEGGQGLQRAVQGQQRQAPVGVCEVGARLQLGHLVEVQQGQAGFAQGQLRRAAGVEGVDVPRHQLDEAAQQRHGQGAISHLCGQLAACEQGVGVLGLGCQCLCKGLSGLWPRPPLQVA